MAKIKQYDQPNSLMLETVRLVKEVGVQEASFQTGLPFLWLRKFASLHYKNPSTNRVQCVYETLSGKQLVSK